MSTKQRVAMEAVLLFLVAGFLGVKYLLIPITGELTPYLRLETFGAAVFTIILIAMMYIMVAGIIGTVSFLYFNWRMKGRRNRA